MSSPTGKRAGLSDQVGKLSEVLDQTNAAVGGELVWDAIYALPKAGNDNEAARLRRALEGKR